MNRQQKQMAKQLYFQADLTKTQIAQILNIPRRTLHYWIKQNNWDRLKVSSEHLPSVIAEQCYFILAQLTKSLITEHRVLRPITKTEAETLHILSLTIKKLRYHTTLNESMEMFATFMEALDKKSPELAKKVAPAVEEYLVRHSKVTVGGLMPLEYNELGFLPLKEPDYDEQHLDTRDMIAWSEGEPAQQPPPPNS